MSEGLSRRDLVRGGLAASVLSVLGLGLGGCASSSEGRIGESVPTAGRERHRFDSLFLHGTSAREIVAYAGRERPGTIVISTRERALFLVQQGGRAIRYSVGVGREGFQWAGTNRISRKAEWPDWTPPPQMLRRRPDLPRFMRGGPANPMGARGLYLGSTLFRIHGSNEPRSIGHAVSSGCIRMHNADVIDLYERVRIGDTVVVRRT
jgi:lipoprotein-anchoring transpeptidase ErfK/SrfK